MFPRVFPHLRPRPIGERADLQECFAARQAMVFDLLEILAGRRLLAALASEPDLERLKRRHQRVDFAKLAAPGRIFSVESAQFGFLLRDSFIRQHIDQIQFPIRGDTIAELISIRKVVSGLQEQNRKTRQPLAEKMKNDHVFRLKAARQARWSHSGTR